MMWTRALNKTFGTAYSFEQVGEMDDMQFALLSWLMPVINPEKPKKG